MPKDMNQDAYSITGQDNFVQIFNNAEDLWFWFMKAVEANNDGALKRSGAGAMTRPCEPNDIFQILNRLHRNRQLLIDHMRILSHYGKRGYAPDNKRPHEMKAATLWHEAFAVLRPIFEQKNFVMDLIHLAYSRHQESEQAYDRS